MFKPFITLITLSFLFITCNQNDQGKSLAQKTDFEIKKRAREMTDSILKESSRQVLFDTVGVSNGPVKVLSLRLITNEYSNYKDISVTYKNVSNKTIEGIRFRWYGENAFGEPADMGGTYTIKGFEGFGNGFSDETIKPGKTRTSKWNILSKDARKSLLAWPYEVAFSDGTKWKSTYKSESK